MPCQHRREQLLDRVIGGFDIQFADVQFLQWRLCTHCFEKLACDFCRFDHEIIALMDDGLHLHRQHRIQRIVVDVSR